MRNATRRAVIVLLAAISFAVQGQNSDSLKFVGSFSNQRFTEEHYYLTEVWLWKTDAAYVGILFIFGGLGGDGPVRPMAIKIDNAVASNGKFSFTAKSFTFDGRLESDRLIGNFMNGSDDWNGGNATTALTQGTNIQTIVNRGATMSSYQEWVNWAGSLQ